LIQFRYFQVAVQEEFLYNIAFLLHLPQSRIAFLHHFVQDHAALTQLGAPLSQLGALLPQLGKFTPYLLMALFD